MFFDRNKQGASLETLATIIWICSSDWNEQDILEILKKERDLYIDKIRANHGVVIIESNGDIATLGKIVKTDGKTVDTSTGEILDDEPMDEPYSPSSFDKETMIYLYDLLDGKMDIA